MVGKTEAQLTRAGVSYEVGLADYREVRGVRGEGATHDKVRHADLACLTLTQQTHQTVCVLGGVHRGRCVLCSADLPVNGVGGVRNGTTFVVSKPARRTSTAVQRCCRPDAGRGGAGRTNRAPTMVVWTRPVNRPPTNERRFFRGRSEERTTAYHSGHGGLDHLNQSALFFCARGFLRLILGTPARRANSCLRPMYLVVVIFSLRKS